MNAHNIKAPGLCHVSGAHLSEAPNEEFLAKADRENTPAVREARRYVRALDEQIAREIRCEVFNRNGGW